MPATNDESSHTTEHVPSPEPSSLEVGTAAFVSEQATGPERAAAAVSIPGYEIECVLGRGGMGVVYKARHLALKRTVALKMILAGGHAGPGELARFRSEAEAVARLQHPNIVQVFEVGEADGYPYCALEFVAGGNLASKLAGKPLPAREAARLVETLARAVQLAHSRNVVHRDLKPSNVLLTPEGQPKITDFGLARRLDSESGDTQAGAILGTPPYMAPEQASGRTHEAGPAADIYALGAILYTCLTGQPPFQGQSMVETLDQVRNQEPVPPSRLRRRVPMDLETICLKCLRKEPEKRYASALELADDLKRYQRGEPIQARPVGRLERALKWVRRNPVPTAAALAVVLVLAVGATYSYLKYRETEAAKDNLAQANGNLAQAYDEVLNVGARGLLRPLGAQVQPNQPQPPLNNQEIEPLRELALVRDEALRVRFVEVALYDPTLRGRLTARAPFAFQAAVGLDARRRARVEQLLVQRLQARESAAEEQEQVAQCLAHLGGLERRLAGRTAATLAQAMSKTTDLYALASLAQGLSAVAARLEPNEAAPLCGQAAATLTQAMASMTRTTVPYALRELVQGLEAVAARLEPKAAAEAAANLVQAISKSTHPQVLQHLAQGLAAVAARLEAKEAAEVAAILTQAMSQARFPDDLRPLAQALAAVGARLEAKEATEVAATLTQAMSRTTDPKRLQHLAQGLAAVAARLGPNEAARACGQAAATLTQAMASMTTRPWEDLPPLAQGLSALAPRLEPKEAAATLLQAMTKTMEPNALQHLAQGLSTVASRLEPNEAARVCGQAAAILTQAMTKDPSPYGLVPLAQGLAAVAARLEPKEATEAAATLVQAMSKNTNPPVVNREVNSSHALRSLAQGLAAVAARLEPKEAAQVCGQAASTLTQVISKIPDWPATQTLTQGLEAVAARLEAKEAAEAAATLTQAMSKTTIPGELASLAEGLAAVAARLEPNEAARLRGQAAAILTQAMTRTPHAGALLAQAVAAHLEPKEAARVCGQAAATLIQTMTRNRDSNFLQYQAQGLSAVLARALPPEVLVDLLKHPCCVSEARRLVLDALARHYQRPFADQWEFVDYAEANKLGLDFTTPPRKP
jgi:hypothetical protein